MKSYCFLFSFLLFSVISFGQKGTKPSKPKVGQHIEETFVYYKDSVTTANYQFPNDAFTLMYRFGEANGTKDNYDSIYKMVSHVYRLNRYFGPGRKRSRLTLYMFVKEVNAEAIALKNKINAWTSSIQDSLVKTERAGFNFTRPWQVLFITDKSQIKPGSILSAEKVSVIAADGKLLESSPLGEFKFKGKKGSIRGKLLTEKQKKKVPLSNVMVTLLNLKTGREEVDSALTDVYGDFEISVTDESSDYSIIVKNHATDVDNIILATQTGEEIARLRKGAKGFFEYKLIPHDIVMLTEKETDDITLLFNKFGGSKETDLKVSENILYALGQYKTDDANSKRILDKVVKILKEHPKVTLEVISHTDAQGDNASNMILSEKRSLFVINYFVANGIDKKRLKGVGKGETEIRNRCEDSVDCSDMEHEFNRRTEFKFRKG